jgi:hypothetical protein
MQQIFNITKTSRNALAQFLEKYTLEQLNKIPEGFNNNLIWNIAHVVVTQQRLVYKLSGLPVMITAEMEAKYEKGSKPEQDVSQAEVDEIKTLLFTSHDQTIADYENKIFKTFQEFTTSTGFTIKNVEDALSFNNFHEALHIGVIMSIKKFL